MAQDFIYLDYCRDSSDGNQIQVKIHQIGESFMSPAEFTNYFSREIAPKSIGAKIRIIYSAGIPNEEIETIIEFKKTLEAMIGQAKVI